MSVIKLPSCVPADMYQEVLKYGAMIVDALRVYRQPVFTYLPPHGELRGGAWVVVDPTINPDHMEMYAGEWRARGRVGEGGREGGGGRGRGCGGESDTVVLTSNL